MALEIDPERRRKLAELARLHDEWQARYGIDDEEFTPDGADSENRRAPSPEQERELVDRTRELMAGSESAQGPLLARSAHEAHLYMDMHSCECGEVRFGRSSTVVTLPDGAVASRYSGSCGRCGGPREFVFRLPAEPLSNEGGELRYGGTGPSQLLDAGEWLWVADRYARAVPADPHRLPPAERRRAQGRLEAAAAAIDEVLKFVPPEEPAVPPASVWSERGGALYAREPGRFRASRLAAVRDGYREAWCRISADSGW